MPDFYAKLRAEAELCIPADQRKLGAILVGVYYDDGNHDIDVSKLESTDFVWLNGKQSTKVSAIQRAVTPGINERNPSTAVKGFHLSLGSAPLRPDMMLPELNPSNSDYVLLLAKEGERPPLSRVAAPNSMSPTAVTATGKNIIKTYGRIKSEPSNMQPPSYIQQTVPQIKSEPGGSQASVPRTSQSPFPSHHAQAVKREPSVKSEDGSLQHHAEESENAAPRNAQIHQLFENVDVPTMEKGIEAGVELLNTIGQTLVNKDTEDARAWLQQIKDVKKQAEPQKTVVGVVGQTGAGKSSVINAILDVERLLPTNCMRACTAVVTEISYNNETDSPYHAKIEFITADDWAKELRVLYQDMLNEDGEIKRAAPESEGAVAWAKIKAVYPKKTKEMLADSTVEALVRDQSVRNILGSTREIDETDPLRFYKRLQKFIDSEEKTTSSDDKKPKEMEFWPLIRVVKLYVKSPTLRSGVVLVDLPGVHDSNSARAAVADRYMQQCTGLWIVAPITRAVDDQSAKKLMGEGFRRQLLMDGGFSSISFICSKSDDISVSEATLSLHLEEELESENRELDGLEEQKKEKKRLLKEAVESKSVYMDAQEELDETLTQWEDLKDQAEDGQEVFAPKDKKSKRKRSASPDPRKAKKARKSADDSDDDFVVDDDEVEESSDKEVETASVDDDEEKGPPLTLEAIEAKIDAFKQTKKEAREEKKNLTKKILELKSDIGELDEKIKSLERKISSRCIAARNKYSTGAIQHDFAAGLRELDTEAAEERYGDEFDPAKELRDYDAIANALPVFCVSSRGYQKLQGRLKKDRDLLAFENINQTGIPDLQKHAMKLTEKGRLASGRKFLTNLTQLCNSLSLWSAADDSSVGPRSASDRTSQGKMLDRRFLSLDTQVDEIVAGISKDLKEELDEIFERYAPAIDLATSAAVPTVEKWGHKVDRVNPPAGGLYWATYKAAVRRDGEYKSPTKGEISFNGQLLEPLIKHIASCWEKTFTRRFPAVLQQYARKSQDSIKKFHRDIKQTVGMGAGIAQLHLLEGQLNAWSDIFKTSADEISSQITAIQREINREFIPVILAEMHPAYAWCAAERGPGQFNRMKNHMVEHVERNKNQMFTKACEAIKKRLLDMVKMSTSYLEETTAKVFGMMERDYRSIFGGQPKQYSGGAALIDKKLKEDLRGVLAGFEDPFKEIVEHASEENDAQKNENDDHEVDREKSDGSKDATPEGATHKNATPGHTLPKDATPNNSTFADDVEMSG